MVLDYPFVWPLWNAAENSQRQVCKQSLTLSESTTCDGLCLASHLFPRKGGALGLVQEFISGEALDELRGAKRWNHGNWVLRSVVENR